MNSSGVFLTLVMNPLVSLRPTGGSITVFNTLFNKAVLLSYAFTLDPYNPMVYYTPLVPWHFTAVSCSVSKPFVMTHNRTKVSGSISFYY